MKDHNDSPPGSRPAELERDRITRYGPALLNLSEHLDIVIHQHPADLPWLCAQLCGILDKAMEKAEGGKDAD